MTESIIVKAIPREFFLVYASSCSHHRRFMVLPFWVLIVLDYVGFLSWSTYPFVGAPSVFLDAECDNEFLNVHFLSLLLQHLKLLNLVDHNFRINHLVVQGWIHNKFVNSHILCLIFSVQGLPQFLSRSLRDIYNIQRIGKIVEDVVLA